LALVASTGKERFVIGALSGKAYESEVAMARRLIPRFDFRKKLPFLGDRGFDCIDLLKLIEKKGALPSIKMKETWRFNIKDPERAKSAQNERKHGKKRTLIEGLFGNIKEKTTSHIKVFKENTARVYALLRLALYNIHFLLKFTKEGGVWVVFRTASCSSEEVLGIGGGNDKGL